MNRLNLIFYNLHRMFPHLYDAFFAAKALCCSTVNKQANTHKIKHVKILGGACLFVCLALLCFAIDFPGCTLPFIQ